MGDGKIDISEFAAVATQILMPKLDLGRCVELLTRMYTWMEVATPDILYDTEEALQYVQQFCVHELGYPKLLIENNDIRLDPSEFLFLIEHKPWCDNLRSG